MRMSAYLIRAAGGAVVGFLALWAWIAAAPLAYLDPEYPAWRAKREMILACDLGDLVILGDSRPAAGILPALLPGTATNLAVGGGKPVEALAMLRLIRACPNPPARFLLSFDPGHFMAADLLWERSVRYGLLRRPDLRELADLSAANNDWSVHEARRADFLTPWARAWVYTLRLPPLYFNSVIKSGGFLRWWSNEAARVRALRNRGQYFFGTASGSSAIAADASLPRFAPNKVLDVAFDRLLELLSGADIWFLPMPINQATNQAMAADIRRDFTRYLAAKADRFPGLRIVEPRAWAWPDSYFGDSFSHLNQAGAWRFSQALATCLPIWFAGGADCPLAEPPQRLHAAPPSTQNEAQNGWFNATEPEASASVAPSSNRGS
jgi:hypothetical protein